MRKHYGIVLPAIESMPILMIDWYQGGKHKTITLAQAKDVVFRAILQGHHVIVDPDKTTPLVAESLVIIDADEFDRSREQWIQQNADKALKAAMDADKGVLP
jgi:hypothetical protein